MNSIASDSDLREKKDEIMQAEDKLLKTVSRCEKLEMSQWRRCTDVSFLQFKERELKKNEIFVGERSSLQIEVFTDQDYSDEESVKTLPLFRNESGKQLLQDLLGYKLKNTDGRIVLGTIMLIVGLDFSVQTAMRCSAET